MNTEIKLGRIRRPFLHRFQDQLRPEFGTYDQTLLGYLFRTSASAVISWSRIRVKRSENQIRGKLANSLAAKWQGLTKNYFIHKHS